MRSSSSKRKDILILDTIAFLSGYALYVVGETYTVEEVLEEVKDRESRIRAENLLAGGRIKVMRPSRILSAESLTPELAGKLSRTDIKLLSLAYELKDKGYNPRVVTDDYALQRACLSLGINYVKVRYPGVKKGD